MILVVEDDEDVRETMKIGLESRGYRVDEAGNGEEALAALQRERPCLMILDLMMPIMTGWELLAQMKTRQITDVPVCVMSALVERTPSDVVGTLSKPFNFQALLAIAARVCSRDLDAETHAGR